MKNEMHSPDTMEVLKAYVNGECPEYEVAVLIGDRWSSGGKQFKTVISHLYLDHEMRLVKQNQKVSLDWDDVLPGQIVKTKVGNTISSITATKEIGSSFLIADKGYITRYELREDYLLLKREADGKSENDWIPAEKEMW